MKAAFVVTIRDGHGLPVHTYGVCAVHALIDVNTRAPRPGYVAVSKASPQTDWTCERCDDESDSSSSPF